MNHLSKMIFVMGIGCLAFSCRRINDTAHRITRTENKLQVISLVISDNINIVRKAVSSNQSEFGDAVEIDHLFKLFENEEASKTLQDLVYDAWDRKFRVRISSDKVDVWSPGPNGVDSQMGGDDIGISIRMFN